MFIRLLFVALIAGFAFCSKAHAIDIEPLAYENNSEIKAIWSSSGEDLCNDAIKAKGMEAKLSMSGDQVKAAHFELPFSCLNSWRYIWDRKLSLDILGEKKVLLRTKSENPSAIGIVTLYLQSGGGWYRFPSFSITEEWQDVSLSIAEAVEEGAPGGWDSITGLRLGFSPGAGKQDTHIHLASIKTSSGWPITHIGNMGPFENYQEARRGILADAESKSLRRDVQARFKKVDALLKELNASKDVSSSEMQEKIEKGRQWVAEAWALVQTPKPEMRGAWVHHGDGTRALKDSRASRWKDSIPKMAEAGINTLFPNVLWSGTSYYPSKVVKAHPNVALEGDYLKEIIEAARPLGMEIHPWKVMWQFSEGWTAPVGRAEPYSKEGRMQIDRHGNESRWLCPCDERNRKEELAAILELADYDVQGIHLDYIRYASRNYSYSKMCRDRFEQARGKKVKAWPHDVVDGGVHGDEYHEFRKDTITSFLRLVRTALKQKKPDLKLSAAVFNVPSIAQFTVSQDWVAWGKEGLLDYILPMNYTRDSIQFKSMVKNQKEALGSDSKAILIPGIQTTFGNGVHMPLADTVEQILVTREAETGGFVVFEWRDNLQEYLVPYMQAGITAPKNDVKANDRAER